MAFVPSWTVLSSALSTCSSDHPVCPRHQTKLPARCLDQALQSSLHLLCLEEKRGCTSTELESQTRME